jgi:hypothetical protein
MRKHPTTATPPCGSCPDRWFSPPNRKLPPAKRARSTSAPVIPAPNRSLRPGRRRHRRLTLPLAREPLRFRCPPRSCPISHPKGSRLGPHGSNAWCTGEDSNLRSSKERQIYSLLPLTARPPVHSRRPLAPGLRKKFLRAELTPPRLIPQTLSRTATWEETLRQWE